MRAAAQEVVKAEVRQRARDAGAVGVRRGERGAQLRAQGFLGALGLRRDEPAHERARHGGIDAVGVRCADGLAEEQRREVGRGERERRVRAREPRKVGVRPHGHTQRLAQAQHARPVAPRLRDGDDIVPRAAEQVHRARAHEQGEHAVAIVRHGQHRRAAAGVQQALAQAVRLHGQQEPGALEALLGIVRHERMRRHRAAERGGAQRHGKRHGAHAAPIGHKGRVAAALGRERQQVELCHEQAGFGREGRVLGEDRAVFRDEVVRGKDGALGRFVRPGVGVDIAAETARGRGAQQRAAVGGLAGRLGRGRAVGDHGRPGEAQPHRRRHRRPHILTQLHTEAKRRHLRAAEHQPRAERHLLPADGHAAGAAVRCRGREAALFREHVVIRQPRFRHYTEDAPAVQHGRAVIELATGAQRHAEHDDGVAVLRVRADVRERRFGRVEQQRGQKQVAARVARHAQLRQHEQGSARAVRLVNARAASCRIAPGIGHGHGDGRRRRAQETVLHGHSSLLGQYAQKAHKKPTRPLFNRPATRYNTIL